MFRFWKRVSLAPPRVTCPFCFHLFYPGSAPLRDPDAAPTAVDEAMSKFLGSRVKASPIIPAGGLFSRLFIDRCYDGGPRRVCPACHLYLPLKTATGELSSPGVAIVGGMNSGKSHYIAVLVKLLESRYGPAAGFSIDPQETYDVSRHGVIRSSELYEQRYGSLWRSAGEIDQTNSVELAGAAVRIPLIYRLLFDERHSPSRLRRAAINLLLFDAAGEDLEVLEKQTRFCTHVAAASGLLFLVDPCELPGIKRYVPPELHSQRLREGSPDGGVASNLVEHLERKFGTAGDGMFDKPAAVVLSKSDLLRSVPGFDRDLVVGECRHVGGLDRAEVDRASRSVRALLLEHAPNLVKRLEQRFRTIKFFAVSALGAARSDRAETPGRVVPVRVGDPLLWLLAQLGYLADAGAPGSVAVRGREGATA